MNDTPIQGETGESYSTSRKPMQMKSWSEKIAKKFEWFNATADYYIMCSRFRNSSEYQRKMQMLYQVYNNRYPAAWFNHLTNPLNSKDPKYKNFPAKMRPVNILRTNLDYLINEFPLRPFVYHVTNMDPDAINAYEFLQNQQISQSMQQAFAEIIQQEEPDVDPSQIPDVTQQKADFQLTYKDKLAAQGQSWVEKTLPKIDAMRKWREMFKDFMLVGECYSYKGYTGNRFTYERVGPLDFDFGQSEGNVFVEDGEWWVRRKLMTISDIVDHFYEDIKQKDLEDLSSGNKPFSNPTQLGMFLQGENGMLPEKGTHAADLRVVFHVQWKGKKRYAVVKEFNPLTGSIDEIEYDEDHPFTDEQKQNREWRWANEIHETWKLAKDLYIGQGCPPVQRNELRNFSQCKSNYNGRRFSDTYAENISMSEIGLPYQIMYMIINRTLELTIAKSKGKILLFDMNAIPDKDGWTEDKFFYYSEAMGYALIDRNKVGVDKNFNQYQVLDMTLFDSIKQLIDLQQHYKQEWDDISGVNRQRRGTMMASDGKGVTEHALNQSAVVTDGIFRSFEEFRESDLKGMLDFSKYDVALGNNKELYYDDEYQAKLFSVDPEEYTNASLDINLEDSARVQRIMDAVQTQVGTALQNQMKFSTALEILSETNIHRLKGRLKQIEAIEAQLAQQNEELKNQFQLDMLEREKSIKELESQLKINQINVEYDRKEDLEMIVGTFNTFTYADGDSDANGVPDGLEAAKIVQEEKKLDIQKSKVMLDKQKQRDAVKQQRDQRVHEQQLQQNELAQKEKDSVRKHKADMKKASQKPKPSKPK